MADEKPTAPLPSDGVPGWDTWLSSEWRSDVFIRLNALDQAVRLAGTDDDTWAEGSVIATAEMFAEFLRGATPEPTPEPPADEWVTVEVPFEDVDTRPGRDLPADGDWWIGCQTAPVPSLGALNGTRRIGAYRPGDMVPVRRKAGTDV